MKVLGFVVWLMYFECLEWTPLEQQKEWQDIINSFAVDFVFLMDLLGKFSQIILKLQLKLFAILMLNYLKPVCII